MIRKQEMLHILTIAIKKFTHAEVATGGVL